ncbi:piezo-type mechanosensitive ion channel component isoform X6 [Dendroctonus ponderosae]|uniref:piezo-type mechanosensitive ion channel component isoform X6 n=1 Tax=Dendroctonus ponderosae TaxID=77166 RepID=UPI002035404D|nr:piezo-type mechanosensitive ion channel component isoform X6 [Dendroctonus ponderosae]
MANYWLSAALFRCLMPLLVGSCIIFRPSVLSAIYFLLLCYTPFVPVPTDATMKGHTGIYLKILIVITTLTTLAQLGFQIALFAMLPYAHFLKDCEFLEKLLRHVGFVRLNNISVNDAFTWISPEPIMLATSVIFYVLFKKITAPNPEAIEGDNRTEIERKDDEIKTRKKYLMFIVGVGRYGVLITLCLAAVLRPSVVGGLYFLVFLAVATWWACYKQLRRGFAILMCCILPFVFGHMCALYTYQFQWPQELLPQNSTWARYFGLTPLRVSSCDNATSEDPRTFTFVDTEWASYINPFALYWLFYILALESKALLQPDLIKGVSPSRRYGSSKRSAIMQDSTGSVTVDGEHPEEIPMDQMGNPEQEYQPTLIENLVYFLENLLQIIIRVSYLGTNIIMMAWSITFISWLTFVLLIWANIIWLVPNQRKSMLRSSPFLVFYAWFLLISAYVYSMDLTESELPSVIRGINLAQIGFVKVTTLPCNLLLAKCLYTCMFWVTLRQYMQEKLLDRQSSALADMVAPLQLTVGAATTGTTAEPQKKETKVMEVVGNYLKRFLTKFWIWVVAITLFAVAITGQRMTGFRIVYMALFLIFILSFQLSFTIWRKMMFGFWLVIIIFSMLVLILTYTYQFDNFPDYWTDYLHVAKEQQLDIGLEQFETKQLFVRMVTPTFFVIITVVQLHYFHNDFMILSDPKNTSIINEDEEDDEDLNESSMQGGAAVERSEKDPSSSGYRFEMSEFDNLTFKAVLEKWVTRLHRFLNLLYLFLEIHMARVVLFFAMLLCIYDKCAMYFILILLIPASFTLGRPMQIFTVYSSSILVSLFLLARMLYQIKYINPDVLNVNCTTSDNGTEINKTLNNMHWLGFDKSDEVGRSVPSLVKWNIIYILVVTLYSVILVRQFNYRIARGKPTTRAFFMFPRITRSDADKSLKNMLKYLANYAYFKFGVEISFLATVAVIAIRMDLYAMFYSIWLVILYSLKRSTLSKVWIFYVLFTAIMLPIQYFMVIGLPPTLCIKYPWNSDPTYIRLQEWAFLMNDKFPPNPKRLIWDFLLLFFLSRQWVVFRIEGRYAGKNYAGGSNESIIHLAEDRNFVNPVPDFITYCRSYLDIAKRCILCSLFYVTLAVVFLAGTNRTNLFSVGYLIGAFLFLWEGSDMYLRPIREIVKKWNWLLGYNVGVILVKAGLQLIGCVFLNAYTGDCHWLMLFGIGCVRKFGNIEDIANLPNTGHCKVPREYLGLFWDAVCFGLLITQKRLFQSYNFFHLINDTKATTILASRGAELIEEMRIKRMDEQVEEEHRILEKIKIKMDRIKANQQKIQAKPPLARTCSESSCTSATTQGTNPTGYHTPIEEEDEEVPPLTPRSSTIAPQAPPSPYSAVMTVSLEAYLEPQRISFSSPPNSDLNPRPASPDESFPVFSPPPYDEAPPYAEAVSEPPRGPVQRQISLGPPWLQGSLVTPRQSVISYSTRSHFSHHEYSVLERTAIYRRTPPKTYKQAIRSGDYYMFDELDDDELDLLPEETREDDEQSDMPTMGEFLNAAIKTDMATVLRERRKSMKRRSSVPLARKKSARSTMSAPLPAPTLEEPTSKSVTIKEEPQPSTSKDEELSELAAPRDYNLFQKSVHWIVFIWAFIESGMMSLTRFLNRYSRDYRYVLKTLGKERKMLKESTDYDLGVRLGSNQLWQPAGSFHDLMRQSTRKASVLTVPEIRIMAPSLERGLDSPCYSRKSSSSEKDFGEEMSSDDQPPIIRLLLAIWYVIMSRSEWLCYFAIFLNQAKTATFLSLPLPLMVFFWGSLTIPRPSKTFWVTIIAYTELVVLIKCLFQMDIIPWNEDLYGNNPFFPPNIIGIQRQKNYANWDLALLLAVFFHRMMLKSMGIWKSTSEPTGQIAAMSVAEGEYQLVDGQLVAVGANGSSILVPVSSSSPHDSARGSNSKSSSKRKSVSSDEEGLDGATSPVSGDETEQELTVESVEVDRCDHIPESLKLGAAKYAESVKIFFEHLLDPTARIAADVYTFMFLCDFINFFVLLVGYSSFGSQTSDGGFAAYLEENRVPPMFLFMLILQFTLIIIDRGIYLRRNILGKLIFQFTQIILLHIWFFVLFPVVTEKEFKTVIPPQVYYMVKCIYFLLSAYQIRCGYPSRILGNCLCKAYSMVNMFLFKGFMLVPFLFELRAVMDWMWTETSMGVFDWLKMEDIFSHIFLLKCSRNMEDEYPQPRGTKKGYMVKYLMGGGLLVGIIGIIWFPLVFFSLGRAVGESNPPYDITLELRIGPYDPIYQMSAQSNSLFQFNDIDYQNLLNQFRDNKRAVQIFSNNYDPGDIVAAKFSQDSAKVWSISPPDKEKMKQEVNSTKPIKVRLDYKVSHKTSSSSDSGIISNYVEISLPPGTPERENLYIMLVNGTQARILLENILPKFLKITNLGTSQPYQGILASESEESDPHNPIFRNLTLTLNVSKQANDEWWTLKEDCSDATYKRYLQDLAYEGCDDSLVIYALSDKIFPSTLNVITGSGIAGLYTTLVLVASRILRGIFAEQVAKIMFEDLPNVDRILQLTLDVYLVREAREFALEEDLFAKLIFLFRSPETMIKWTRPKEELDDDEDPEDN